jgi:hypothetical protein
MVHTTSGGEQLKTRAAHFVFVDFGHHLSHIFATSLARLLTTAYEYESFKKEGSVYILLVVIESAVIDIDILRRHTLTD